MNSFMTVMVKTFPFVDSSLGLDNNRPPPRARPTIIVEDPCTLNMHTVPSLQNIPVGTNIEI
jgi:hypothetical protein